MQYFLNVQHLCEQELVLTETDFNRHLFSQVFVLISQFTSVCSNSVFMWHLLKHLLTGHMLCNRFYGSRHGITTKRQQTSLGEIFHLTSLCTEGHTMPSIVYGNSVVGDNFTFETVLFK